MSSEEGDVKDAADQESSRTSLLRRGLLLFATYLAAMLLLTVVYS